MWNNNLIKSKIESLPEGLVVWGNLWLNNTKINSLPENLKVGQDLDLSMLSIKTLPKGLAVGGDLYIAIKYTDDEIREMIKPGFVLGRIRRIWEQNN